MTAIIGNHLFLKFLIFFLLTTLSDVICIDNDFQIYPSLSDEELNAKLSADRGFLVGFNKYWPPKGVNRNLGVISSVKAVDESASDVFVLHRGDRIWDNNTFDQKNNYRLNKSVPIKAGVVVRISDEKIKETYLPKKFYLPHGLTIDSDGNFWITDVALHQVFKFSPYLSGEPLLVLGERFKPGSDDRHFCKPTDVVVSANGQIFVSDGYCNNRIMKFDRSGKFLKSWGSETENSKHPGQYELNLPHQLALFEEEDAVCTADRENKRIVCYTAGLYSQNLDYTGKFLFEYIQPDSQPIYGVAVEPSKKLLLALVGSTGNKDDSKVEIIDFSSQTMMGEIKNELKVGFGDVHSISTCPNRWKISCILLCNTDTPPQLRLLKDEKRSILSDSQQDNLQDQLERRLWLYHLQLDSE